MADIFELFKKISKESDAKSTQPVSYIVAGLGNPDAKYSLTRHNAGFMCVDFIGRKEGFALNRAKYKSLCSECVISGQRVVFLKPQTYMNNSGEALHEAADFYKVPAEKIIVIFDDISMDVGKLRIRKKGSDGGHNGIKSIIQHLGSDAFMRIKIGIGAKPYPNMDLADWVLSKFTKEQLDTLEDVFLRSYKALALMLNGETDKAMNLFN